MYTYQKGFPLIFLLHLASIVLLYLQTQDEYPIFYPIASMRRVGLHTYYAIHHCQSNTKFAAMQELQHNYLVAQFYLGIHLLISLPKYFLFAQNYTVAPKPKVSVWKVQHQLLEMVMPQYYQRLS